MDDITFGQILRRMRSDAGKKVPEVSKHLTSLGYKAAIQTIYGWERGLSQPNPDPFLEMCRFYGIRDILSYFGDAPIEIKKSPSATETATEDLFASAELMELKNIYCDKLNAEGRKRLMSHARYLTTEVECIIAPPFQVQARIGKVIYLNCNPPEE